MAAGDSTPKTTAKPATTSSSGEATTNEQTALFQPEDTDYTAQLLDDLRRTLFLADRIGRMA